jgi:hypothetical protein
MNKKTFLPKFIFSAFLLVLPTKALAQQVQPFRVNSPVSPSDLPSAVALILDVAFGIVGVVAVVYLVIGGFRYITSGGNAEVVEQAKATITNAVIGLVAVLLAALIIHYVLQVLGFQNGLILGRGSYGSSYQPGPDMGGYGGGGSGYYLP